MRTWTWTQTEFLLKGVYLGLLVTIAWLVPTLAELGLIGLATFVGLALFLGVAAARKIREGYRVRGRWLGFLIFILLETPYMVYSGLLVGLSVGTWLTFKHFRGEELPPEAMWPVLGGAGMGGIFFGLRNVRQRMYRFWLSFAMVLLFVGGAAAFFYFKPTLLAPGQQLMIGTLLLLGIPGFYLLTFSGLVEESEVEIGVMCAALGIGLWTWLEAKVSPTVGGVAVLLPLAIFFLYTTRVMPGLRVFKHALRGMSYRDMGQTRLALISLGRALELDPGNALARHQLWDLHRDLDFAILKHQPDLLPYLNFDFCLERISQILQTRPGPEDLRETLKMLDLIAEEQPAWHPTCAYWRAVALLHEHNYEEAAANLASVLQLPQVQTPQRQGIHFAAWQLAIFGHPEMARRVGNVLLAMPGQRMDAIAATETQLAITPNDPGAWDMKRQLYSELTESEYWGVARPDVPIPPFNHEYVQQLGLALLDNPEQWKRGCEYLRIAAHGLPMQAANLHIQIAQFHEKFGESDGMWANYRKAMQIGRAIGANNLPVADRESLFATVKKIGELAVAQNQLDTGLEAYKFYTLYENAGLETYRTLAELFERKQKENPADLNLLFQALHCTEHALTYNPADKDLMERKDRYYYSITPDELRARLENVRKWFDPQYCRDKARWVLERFNGDFDVLDWAAHLVELALIAQPGSHDSRLLKGRIHRLRGEIPETIAILEEVRQHRPEKFANEEEEKAWYFSHRLLGDLYLDEHPEQAAACFEEFRKSDESGADTSYKLGRAYEALGKFKEAAQCYESVTAYERHPLFYDAREALDRIRRRPA